LGEKWPKEAWGRSGLRRLGGEVVFGGLGVGGEKWSKEGWGRGGGALRRFKNY